MSEVKKAMPARASEKSNFSEAIKTRTATPSPSVKVTDVKVNVRSNTPIKRTE